MTDVELQVKCKRLLARRDLPASPWFYARNGWQRQVLFVTAYIGVSAALWFLDMRLLSVGFAGFLVGRLVRDLRWWNALAREWPATRALLDWPRIEKIAGGESDTGGSVV